MSVPTFDEILQRARAELDAMEQNRRATQKTTHSLAAEWSKAATFPIQMTPSYHTEERSTNADMRMVRDTYRPVLR